MRLHPSRLFTVEPSLPAALEPLRAIAANLYWAWSPDAIALFEHMSRDRWHASGHNPVKFLQTFPLEDLERLAQDENLVRQAETVYNEMREYLAQKTDPVVSNLSERDFVAYFSLEFALAASLPVYSGGLGVLAGDHLKSASDMGLPLVGISLLYREGYFQQVLAQDGWQHEEYSDIDIAAQPLAQVRDDSGAPLMVSVPIAGRDVRLAIWRLEVGRRPLFLLDSDVESNSEADRAICSRVYGGDIETRIQQEMILGIGGIRALKAMGLQPAVCHMNEGHSALLGLDRIRILMEETGLSFEEAVLPISAATVFTTHTAVAAGIDLFPPDLIRKHLGAYYSGMGLDDRSFIGLGRSNPDDPNEPFSMALLGLHLSGFRNGVSKLHRSVSQQLWEGTWPNLPQEQIPIDSITNGVHLPTWVSHDMGEIYDRAVGPKWRQQPCDAADWQRLHDVPSDELWNAHVAQRHRLITRARQQNRESAARRGVSGSEAGGALDPDMLTIGFARRFASYKRATLLFRDPQRLSRILNNAARPVQFLFAGKAHPRDEPAKQLIREVVEHSRRPEFRDRLVILERYDLDLAADLVQGCDVWLNTPLRPLEASGTSGMKAVANGALHLSVLDGWWAEAYQPGLGWAIGGGRTDEDPDVQDIFDSESLYQLLEADVVPAFYDRDPDGIPRRWIDRMKRSVAAYAPVFNTNRMVGEYAERAYAAAATSFASLREDGGRRARDLAAWLSRVRAGWQAIKICAVEDDAPAIITAGGPPVTVTVQIHPGNLTPSDLRVEVVTGAVDANGDLQPNAMIAAGFLGVGEDGICRYTAVFRPGAGGRAGYAIRVLPNHPDLHDPFMTGLVLWA